MAIVTQEKLDKIKMVEQGGWVLHEALKDIIKCLEVLNGDLALCCPENEEYTQVCDGVAGNGVETGGGLNNSLDPNFIACYPTFAGEQQYINKFGDPKQGSRFYDTLENCVKVYNNYEKWVCENDSELCRYIEQPAHGFTVLDQIWFNQATGEYELADANSVFTIGTASVVEVCDTNRFKVACMGTYEIPNHGYTECYHFADPSTLGGVMENPTTLCDTVDQPSFCVLDGDTIKLLNYMRPRVIGLSNPHKKKISQASHGFVPADLLHGVFSDGSNWGLSDPNDPQKWRHGILTEIIDADTFCVQSSGYLDDINIAQYGVIAGEQYFDDYGNPSNPTLNPPAVGQYCFPLYQAVSPECLLIQAGDKPTPIGTNGQIVSVTDFQESSPSGDSGSLLALDGNGEVDVDFVRGIPIATNPANFQSDSARPPRIGDMFFDVGLSKPSIYDPSTICNDGPRFRSFNIRNLYSEYSGSGQLSVPDSMLDHSVWVSFPNNDIHQCGIKQADNCTFTFPESGFYQINFSAQVVFLNQLNSNDYVVLELVWNNTSVKTLAITGNSSVLVTDLGFEDLVLGTVPLCHSISRRAIAGNSFKLRIYGGRRSEFRLINACIQIYKVGCL